ncbi:MAG: DUF4300 family protein [Thomasclavelia sp.]|uniref:DUF4300 family protein n=1 Tax=Thomasclavelia sp. TaxID=3025757 RepID=UPI0039A39A82
MLKKITIIVLSLFIFIGCSSNKPIVYSNLNNDASQQELVTILKDTNIPTSNIKQFISYIDDFNQSVSTLIGDFKELPNDGFIYEHYIYNNTNQNDINSLIPTFTLIKNFIYTNNNAQENDAFLLDNLNSIDTVNKYSMNKKDRLKFITTFNSISVSGIKNNKISHINQIVKTFNDREFEIKNNQNISLITLWSHTSLQNIRFINHCGVLVNRDNELYFIEKYDQYYPYQITKFNNRKELKTYLLSRHNLDGNENDGQPLIFENNKYLND